MAVAEGFFVVTGQCSGQLHHILDLSPVQVPVGKLPHLFRRRILHCQSQTGLPNLIEEGFPYILLRGTTKVVVVQREMDTRLEGLVKRFDTVGRQEENAAKISESWR